MKMENLTIAGVREGLLNKDFSCEELVKFYLANIEKHKDKNAILEVFEDAIAQAQKCDEVLASGKTDLPKLFGVPMIIKDNIMLKGKIASCASKFLERHVSEYTSSALQKLLDEGAIVIARANMDEFAMGGSCENSAFGPCKNALDDTRVSGGSSGGSAVAVALDMCTFALGTDTGGSVRQPASFNGIVGIKPTYARVSRYGVIAYASSFDQIGPLAKNVKDCALVLEIMAGKDKHDETTLESEVPAYSESLEMDARGLRIGVLKQTQELTAKTEYKAVYDEILDWFKKGGADIVEVQSPSFNLNLPTYYTLVTAEATSNLGRFDGVKYTRRAEGCTDIDSVYVKSRTEGFGKEVKRRIMLGNFVLSSGFYDAYYMKAMKVRSALRGEFSEIFKNCDVVILPTAYGEAFELGSKTQNPVDMYVEDMFTTLAPLLGTPAISVPCGKGKNGLPLGLQIMGAHEQEQKVLAVANFFAENFGEGV